MDDSADSSLPSGSSASRDRTGTKSKKMRRPQPDSEDSAAAILHPVRPDLWPAGSQCRSAAAAGSSRDYLYTSGCPVESCELERKRSIGSASHEPQTTSTETSPLIPRGTSQGTEDRGGVSALGSRIGRAYYKVDRSTVGSMIVNLLFICGVFALTASISAFVLPVEWIESDYQALILVAVFLACFALFWGILRAGFIFARELYAHQELRHYHGVRPQTTEA